MIVQVIAVAAALVWYMASGSARRACRGVAMWAHGGVSLREPEGPPGRVSGEFRFTHIADVAAITTELHDAMALSRQSCPA